VSICTCERLPSVVKGVPHVADGIHGGMRRATTASFIAAAIGCACA
jgi:hypothetical protein